jgi:hypothetical protein
MLLRLILVLDELNLLLTLSLFFLPLLIEHEVFLPLQLFELLLIILKFQGVQPLPHLFLS